MLKKSKNNKSKKRRVPKLDIKKAFSVTKKMLPVLLSIFVLALLSIQFYLFIYKSGCFTVTDIEVMGAAVDKNDSINKLVSQLKGVNIFDVELSFYSRKFKELIPEAENVIITRKLPNRLVINIKTRKPYALLDLNNARFLIDSSGFILAGADDKGDSSIPLITGIGWKKDNIRVGRQIDSKRLTAALACLKGLLPVRKVVRVDAHDPNNILLYTEDGLEIKARGDDFDSKVKLLAYVLPEAMESKAKYVDMRFKDIVIGR